MGNTFNNSGNNYGQQTAGDNYGSQSVDNRRVSNSSELVKALNELASAIRSSRNLSDSVKGEQLGMIDTMEREANKPNPNKTMLKSLSDGLIAALKAIPDVANAVSAVASLIPH